MNGPLDINVTYQEAGTLFRHASTLRRITLAFVFTATGASLAMMGNDPGKFTPFNMCIAFVNVVLVLAALLQEAYLRAYQKQVAEFLRGKEGRDGPYYATRNLPLRKDCTRVTAWLVDGVLGIGWIAILAMQLYRQLTS